MPKYKHLWKHMIPDKIKSLLFIGITYYVFVGLVYLQNHVNGWGLAIVFFPSIIIMVISMWYGINYLFNDSSDE
ncbi:hypothetical protein [Evansella tamaricis]|uniref:Uncharacterized protein n=1 Tax=Evansella tamaricis TaxID=2069301 RepID=A0ABS6JBR7_9BACI|nr:hypothetical protein [Evansella tamaricis]MBU9711085.1 hypothetical protein [Evansella tamaricis]